MCWAGPQTARPKASPEGAFPTTGAGRALNCRCPTTCSVSASISFRTLPEGRHLEELGPQRRPLSLLLR